MQWLRKTIDIFARTHKSVIYMTQYFAHSANRAGSGWEPLIEHISSVARRAGEYAESFGARQEAIIAGMWHDLGKYGDLFSARLRGEVSGLDHWSLGAMAVLHKFRDKALAAALAIQGHHIGLQEGLSAAIRAEMDLLKISDLANHPYSLRLTEGDPIVLISRFLEDGLAVPPPPVASLYDFSHLPFLGCSMQGCSSPHL